MSVQSQIDKGRMALKYFHNQALKYEGYNLKLDDLINRLGTPKQIPIHLEGIGDQIDMFQLPESKVEEAMEALADRGQGKVPPAGTSTPYENAIGGKAGEVNWVDATAYVATDVAVKVGDGLQVVGTSVLDTFGTLFKIAPILIVGAVIFIVVRRTKEVAG
jgi:hypothetical protein